jgi:hypothetical protein
MYSKVAGSGTISVCFVVIALFGIVANMTEQPLSSWRTGFFQGLEKSQGIFPDLGKMM